MKPSELENGLLLLKSAQTFKTDLDDLQLSQWAQDHLEDLIEENKKLKKALIKERFWRLWKIADARYENPVQRVTQKAISELNKEGFDIEDL